MDIIQEEEKEEKKQHPEDESEKGIDGKKKVGEKIKNEEEIKIIRKTILPEQESGSEENEQDKVDPEWTKREVDEPEVFNIDDNSDNE